MLIIADLESEAQAVTVAERIRLAILKPYMIRGMQCSVGVSIGICIFPDGAGNADELVTCADMAMYEAKNKGKNTYRFFDPELKIATERKIKIDNALKHAIEKNELHLRFQPKVRLGDSKLVGAEALLRWENAELGTFAPDEFIAQAETNGLICEMDEWVLKTVINYLASWDPKLVQPPKIAINFSATQAARPNLADTITRIAAGRTDILQQLEIEITETSAFDNLANVENNIRSMRALGISVAMDDFGAGHSSLTLLTRCDIDTLKIDKEVTQGIKTDARSKEIVRSIIEHATKLNVNTVAEGIEDKAQAAALASMDCDFGQGYFYSCLLYTSPSPRDS